MLNSRVIYQVAREDDICGHSHLQAEKQKKTVAFV